MKSRYLLGAGAALAMALGGAEANAQTTWFGYPVTWYVGPEGGWTSLANQKNTIHNGAVQGRYRRLIPPNGPFTSSFTGSARYNSGFNAGARIGGQFGPWRVEEEYSYRHNGLSSFGVFFGPNINSALLGNRTTNSLMTNLIYDFGSAFLFSWPISPHIGFGIGAVDNIQFRFPRPGHPHRPAKDHGQYPGGHCRCNRGNIAVPESHSRWHLLEG